MGHLGPVPRQARSPDLNPLYFFLWGHLKTLVYATPVDHVDDRVPRIVDGCNTIRTTPGLLAGAAVNASALPALFTRRERHFEALL